MKNKWSIRYLNITVWNKFFSTSLTELMKRILVFLFLTQLAVLQAQSGSAIQIVVQQEQHLDTGLPDHAFVESQLSVNPSDPRHLLAGAIMIDPESTDSYWNVALTTKDGGAHWHFHRFEIPLGADPWGIISDNGEAVFSVLGLDSLYVYHSADGGINWSSNPTNLGNAHDHQVLIQDRSAGPYQHSIYLSSIKGNDIFVARSTDHGRSFAVASQFKANNLNTNTLTPVVLSDGTLVVSFVNFQRLGYSRRCTQ